MQIQITARVTEEDVRMQQRIAPLFDVVLQDGCASQRKERWAKALNRLATRNNEVHAKDVDSALGFLSVLERSLDEQTDVTFWRELLPSMPETTVQGFAAMRKRDRDDVRRYVEMLVSTETAMREALVGTYTNGEHEDRT